MKVTAKLNNLRISPRKVRESADLIRGCEVSEALYRLESAPRRCSQDLSKLIKSAIANAENNFDLNKDNLYIFEIEVNEGPTMKRWMPRAYGRATQILKRTSKVNLTLEELKVEKEEEKKVVDEKKKTDESSKKKEVEVKKPKRVPTKGSKKTEEKVVDTKKDISKESKVKHKKIEGSQDRQLSRQPGETKKIFKKTSDKK